jgi:hypothetical protein
MRPNLWSVWPKNRTDGWTLGESGCTCSLWTEIGHDSVLTIRIPHDCNRGTQPSYSALFRTVRMENASSGRTVAAEKLQRSDGWIPNLIAIKKPRNSRFDSSLSLWEKTRIDGSTTGVSTNESSRGITATGNNAACLYFPAQRNQSENPLGLPVLIPENCPGRSRVTKA